MKLKFFILINLFPLLLFAQIYYLGNVSPTYLMRISDGTDISLPFRIAEVQVGYSIGDFELKTNAALEARWQGTETELELREAYLKWYPRFGEVKVGKIIHTWGAADGNNPTDNINPYDFYYMFLAGTDRKIGILSGSIKKYWNNFNLEGIFIPEYVGNRLPFNEDDFPIDFPYQPDEYIENDRIYEYGARLQGTFNLGDISVSYFNGYDDLFSLQYLTPTDIPNFGYRGTQMIGTDFVTFYDDFTFRGELGYFDTKDDLNKNDTAVYFDVVASYIQYVLQLEYSGISDINIGIQFLSTDVFDASGLYFTGVGIEDLTKDNFTPGMGIPFAIIIDKGLIVNSSISLFDSSLELEIMGLINLKDTGYLIGLNTEYSPYENWKLVVGINKFIGDEEDPDNNFTKMEDFSHVSFGLEFSF